ncbi:MAG: acyltransferase, partial [Ktedonobacteraceae bacterium]|nr:acyltransferase [Ktedonobacteraceae bacterium]
FAFTTTLNQTAWGLQVQNAVVVSIHFTRALFMFVTAFAMVYVYYGKPFSLKRFWKKRAIGVVLPYCIWSLVYVWINSPQASLGKFLQVSILETLTGNASYQLYYILLTLQFYLILPLFLLFLKAVQNRPILTLSISFLLQVLIFYVDFHYIQAGPFASISWVHQFSNIQSSLVLLYQFYFVLGAFCALYFQPLRAFLLRHGKWILCAMLVSVIALWGHFFLQILVYREKIEYAVSVLQPIMVLYSSVITLCAFWLACRWTRRADKQGRPRGYRQWHWLSDASFGVYLIHALILTAVLRWVTPAMPVGWPVALRVLLTWLLTAGSSILISIALVHMPIGSRLVGRSRPFPRWLTEQNVFMLKALHKRQV